VKLKNSSSDNAPANKADPAMGTKRTKRYN
jgi:hypothetical protein